MRRRNHMIPMINFIRQLMFDQATVYSFMIKVEDERVTMIDRDAKSASIPPGVKCIGIFACFSGSLVSLNLCSTNIQIIEKFAFSHCFSLQSVSLPSCLEKICEGSFQNCRSLVNVTFGENPQLREIGDRSFRKCEGLEHFEFPPLLEIIGDDSFKGCSKIKTFDLRSTKVRKVGNFVGYREDAAIYLPASVSASNIVESGIYSSIGSDDGHPCIKRDECGCMFCDGKIFQGDKRMKHVFIRRGIEAIAKYCFCKSNLVSITIPASVMKISEGSFEGCKKLEHIRFLKDSQLKEIKSSTFGSCILIKKILFPKSLKVLRCFAFYKFKSLEQVIFPRDSQLEEIDSAFCYTSIKQLSLPPSIKKIKDVCYGMNHLESIYVNSAFYKSNRDGTAIYSNDGCELVCVIKAIDHFEIPDSVRVIKSNAFRNSRISGRLTIPSSVEIIESQAFSFCYNLKIIEFSSESRLKSIECDSLCNLSDLIISNENFIKRVDGVVISLNPAGIVFVPKRLTDLKVDFNVEVIHSCAFYESRIQSLNFPKSLKKIEYRAFKDSDLRDITFEEGTELDYIESDVFDGSKILNIKLPLVKDSLKFYFLHCKAKSVEFPPNFNPSRVESFALSGCSDLVSIICPVSSLQALALIEFNIKVKILED